MGGEEFVVIMPRTQGDIACLAAERLRRAGDKINAAQRSQGKPEVDAGFRVYTLADDPHALVHRTPLDQATQADVAALQAAIATPQPEQRPVVLANLLLTEGLPLSATLTPLTAGGVADADPPKPYTLPSDEAKTFVFAASCCGCNPGGASDTALVVNTQLFVAASGLRPVTVSVAWLPALSMVVTV